MKKDNTGNRLKIEVPKQASDFSITAENHPYSVWLHMNGRPFPMPIGNLTYPYKHSQLEIAGTEVEDDRTFLILNVINPKP
jgi:hypothetical protein